MDEKLRTNSETTESRMAQEFIHERGKALEVEQTPLKCLKNEDGGFELKAVEGRHIKKIVGVRDDEIAEQILKSSANTLDTYTRDYVDGVNLSLQTLHDQKPKDAIEARLITQAGALYTNGMDYLAMAVKTDSLSWKEYYVNSSIKLLRLHNETVEALNRYRRGGEQRVTVMHVAQQMAVANHFVSSGGGGDKKKKELVHDD